MGAEKQAKGSVGRWQRRHAPPCEHRSGKVGGRPPPCAPPPGTCLAGSVSAAEASPPLSFPQRQVEQVPPGFRRGDARGEAPCIKKLKISPFPGGEGGKGDGGKQIN